MSDFEQMDLGAIVRQGEIELQEATFARKKCVWSLEGKMVEVTGIPMGVTNGDLACDGWLGAYDQLLLYFSLESGSMGAALKAASELKKQVNVQGKLCHDDDGTDIFGVYSLDVTGIKFGKVEEGYTR